MRGLFRCAALHFSSNGSQCFFSLLSLNFCQPSVQRLLSLIPKRPQDFFWPWCSDPALGSDSRLWRIYKQPWAVSVQMHRATAKILAARLKQIVSKPRDLQILCFSVTDDSGNSLRLDCSRRVLAQLCALRTHDVRALFSLERLSSAALFQETIVCSGQKKKINPIQNVTHTLTYTTIFAPASLLNAAQRPLAQLTL